MFGYVNVNNAELKVKEYEFYRGTYCGLCRSMGKCTGQCSRMTLNYDFVFLALVRLAIDPVQIEFEQKRCFVHPLKKRNSMVRNEILDYCASASAILNYHKVKDDIADEKGFSRFTARVLLPFVAHSRKKALRKNGRLKELDAAVSARLCELSELEKQGRASVDTPADCFGALLGEIMSFGFEGADRRIAYELGRAIGAWIYIADAIDDMGDDKKKKRYNPILALYEGRVPNDDELDSIAAAVRNRLYGAEAAFDLIELDDGAVKNIIQNILYLGITAKTDKIIKRYSTDNEIENRREEDKND